MEKAYVCPHCGKRFAGLEDFYAHAQKCEAAAKKRNEDFNRDLDALNKKFKELKTLVDTFNSIYKNCRATCTFDVIKDRVKPTEVKTKTETKPNQNEDFNVEGFFNKIIEELENNELFK